MIGTHLGRRTFLSYCAALAMVATTRSCFAGASPGGHDQSTMFRMARLLFPHERLDDAVYDAAAQSLYSLPTDASLLSQLRDGVTQLDRLADGDWLSADPEQQVAAMRRIEHSDFFVAVRERVRLRLYRDPVVWDLIGYPGPSAPLGYIDRGFADIDWLPDS